MGWQTDLFCLHLNLLLKQVSNITHQNIQRLLSPVYLNACSYVRVYTLHLSYSFYTLRIDCILNAYAHEITEAHGMGDGASHGTPERRPGPRKFPQEGLHLLCLRFCFGSGSKVSFGLVTIPT